MTMHRVRTGLLAGAIVAGGVLGIPGIAAATTSQGSTSPLNPAVKNATTFKVAQQWVEHQLALRQQRLTNLAAEVSKAADLSTSDRTTLASDVSSDTVGIDALAAKVPDDKTWAQLLADAKSMVVDYRVFTVMSPQVHLTIAADTASAIEQKLQTAEPQIEAAIQAAAAEGKNVAAAQTAYEGLVVQVSDAAADTSGVSATVIAQTAAGYPANAGVFLNARSNLEQARTALKTARADLGIIAKVLKS
jgi:hypothetical protein